MPRFDGTGPLGKGPMTGRGEGFCVLRKSRDRPQHVEGFVGAQGKPLREIDRIRIENDVPDAQGDVGTDSAGSGSSQSKARHCS